MEVMIEIDSKSSNVNREDAQTGYLLGKITPSGKQKKLGELRVSMRQILANILLYVCTNLSECIEMSRSLHRQNLLSSHKLILGLTYRRNLSLYLRLLDRYYLKFTGQNMSCAIG